MTLLRIWATFNIGFLTLLAMAYMTEMNEPSRWRRQAIGLTGMGLLSIVAVWWH